MSGAHSRNKGAKAERDVAAWLRNNGWPDARRYLAGDGNQPGDIDAIPGVVLEIKNHGIYDIPRWLRQTVEEANGRRIPILVVKPKGVTDVADWWAITPFYEMVDLLGDGE